MALSRNEAQQTSIEPPAALTEAELFAARSATLNLYLAPQLEQYIVALVMGTRRPSQLDPQLGQWLQWGVSPRASIALERCARARAWLHGRDFVSPEDIQAVAPNVLRHRILLSYQAEAEGISKDQVIARLLQLVAVP